MKATGANGQRTETARHPNWSSIENKETVLLPGERVFHSSYLNIHNYSQRTPKKILTVLTRCRIGAAIDRGVREDQRATTAISVEKVMDAVLAQLDALAVSAC